MKNTGPINELVEIFKDNLEHDWDEFDDPEMMILGVPYGTVKGLIIKINQEKLWEDLYEVSENLPDQWILAISNFFPREESYIEPLYNFMKISKTDHAKICFAQELCDWTWGEKSKKYLSDVIGEICKILENLKNKSGMWNDISINLKRGCEYLDGLNNVNEVRDNQ